MAALRRLVGNRAVSGLVQTKLTASSPLPIQCRQRLPVEPVQQTIARLVHPKIALLEISDRALKMVQGYLEAPSAPLDTKAERKRWQGRLWTKLTDTGLYRRYKEAGGSVTRAIVWFIGWMRKVVNSLTTRELGVVASVLRRIKGYYHRRLNSYAPYFTQMANRNLLWKKTGRKTSEAWRRTCNMTSLAMALQASGVTTSDFAGDKALLAEIGRKYEPAIESFGDLESLRMPDFLQLVAIYIKYEGGNDAEFDKRVDTARQKAAKMISTTLQAFESIAATFGVRRVKQGFIRSTGSQKEKNIQTDVQEYKAQVLKGLGPWLDVGGQVVVNRPGHYVRLESIDDDGIVIDDPATKGKNFEMSWKEANEGGYFRSYQVFLKQS
jgi:hypothetical protein